MAFILPGDPAVKDPTKASLAVAINDALSDLNSRLSAFEGSALPNGSFEFDLDADGEPDNWTIIDLDGGTHAISTNAQHGAKSLKIITNGTGGRAEGLSDAFVPCGEDNIISTMMFFQRTTASIRARLQVLYFDETETITATDTIYDDAGAGVAWNIIARTSTVPSGAHFYKVKVIGGESGGGTVAGNIYFDGVAASQLTQELFAVGEHIWAELAGPIDSGPVGSPTKTIEFVVPKNGALRIDFTLEETSASGTAAGRVYRNGVAVGTNRTASPGPTTFTEDISGWDAGDLCQIFQDTTGGSTNSRVTDFKIKVGANTLDGIIARLDI